MGAEARSVVRIFESIRIFETLSSAAIWQADTVNTFWYGGCGSGTVGVTLDGAAVSAGTAIPQGTHLLTAAFTNCLTDLLVGTAIDGAATADYTAADLDTVMSHVTATGLSGALFSFRSDLYQVTVDGSGAWTRTRSGSDTSVRFAPAPGSRLTDRQSGRSVTFDGGTYSRTERPTEDGLAWAATETFENVAIVVEGAAYLLHGRLELRSPPRALMPASPDELSLTSNGTRIARLYPDPSGGWLRIEVLAPPVPF